MKRFIYSLCLLFTMAISTQGQNWDWGQGIAASGDQIPTALTVDGNGNSYLACHFSNSLTLDGKSISSTGREDFLIVSYASDGSFRWALRGGGTGDDLITDLRVDNSGNLWVLGYLTNSADVDGTSTNIYGAMVLKIQSNGTILETQGCTTQGIAGGLAIDGNDNVYISIRNGRKYDLVFGGKTLETGTAYEQSYLLKLDKNAVVLNHWLFTDNEGNKMDMPGSIECGTKGHLYIGGIQDRSIFLAKWKTGKWIWYKEQRASTGARFRNIILNENTNRIYLGGLTTAPLSFGGPANSSETGNPGFIAAFDTSGKNLKLLNINEQLEGSATFGTMSGMSRSMSGNDFYITGEFNTQIIFNNGMTLNAMDGLFNDNDAYVVAFDSSLKAVKGSAETGTHREYGSFVESNRNGKVVMTGGYYAYSSYTAQFGSDVLPVAGGRNCFLAQGEPKFVAGPAPIAGFEYQVLGGLTVKFTDKSSDASTQQWIMDNGDTLSFGATANFTYTFSEAGTYSVCQKVTNPQGDDQTCQSITVSEFDPKISKMEFPVNIENTWPSNLATVGEKIVLVAELRSAWVYRSADNGLSWNKVLNKRVLSMKDAGNGTVYAISGKRLTGLVFTPDSFLVSKDDGKTWKAIAEADFKHILAIDNNGNIYCGDHTSSGSYLYKSTDEGKSWTRLANSPGNSMFASFSDNGTLVVSTYNSQISYSEDGGATFQKADIDIGNITVGRIWLGPDDSLYTSTGFSAYTSSDNGKSWKAWDTKISGLRSDMWMCPNGEKFIKTPFSLHYAENGYTFNHIAGAPLFTQLDANGSYAFGLVDSLIYRINLTGISDSNPPAAPTNLVVSNQNKKNDEKLKLSWKDNSDNEDGFIIYRDESASGTFNVIDTLGVDIESYIDEGLKENTLYDYYVVAFNAAGESDPSNTTGITTSIENTRAGTEILEIFPNPAREEIKLKIQLTTDKTISYKICDLSGRTIAGDKAGHFRAGEHLITMNMLPKQGGIYFLKLQLNDQVMVYRIQIE